MGVARHTLALSIERAHLRACHKCSKRVIQASKCFADFTVNQPPPPSMGKAEIPRFGVMGSGARAGRWGLALEALGRGDDAREKEHGPPKTSIRDVTQQSNRCVIGVEIVMTMSLMVKELVIGFTMARVRRRAGGRATFKVAYGKSSSTDRCTVVAAHMMP